MQRIRERLQTLESLFTEHPFPESLRRIAGELESLAAYARLAGEVDPGLRNDLAWTAGLYRDCWSLVRLDRAGVESASQSRRARVWELFGSLLDRTQDLLSAKPLTTPDVLLDAMSVVLPWIGGTAYVRGAEASHAGALVGPEARLEEVLWRYFTAASDAHGPDEAWAVIEEKRAAVERCVDLIFVKSEDPRTQAATLLLLYLSVAVSQVNRLARAGA